MRRDSASSIETLTPRFQSIDEQLRFVIVNKRLIQFRYHESLRVAEPHDYGIQKGRVNLLVYQLRGPVHAPPKDSIGWRTLHVPQIQECIALEETFQGSRGRSYRRHLVWDVVFARVE